MILIAFIDVLLVSVAYSDDINDYGGPTDFLGFPENELSWDYQAIPFPGKRIPYFPIPFYPPEPEPKLKEKEKIILIESENNYNRLFNYIFQRACDKYYDIERSQTIKKDFVNLPIIYFAVPGTYNYNDDDNIEMEDMKFVFAGSVTDPNEMICTKINNDLYCNETVNLVHIPDVPDSLLNFETVFNFIQTFQINRTEYPEDEERCRPRVSIKNLNTIVICQPLRADFFMHLKSKHDTKFNLIQADDSNCDETIEANQHRLLAILRNEAQNESPVPTVLLRTPYISSADQAVLPNSMNLVPWQPLKFGIVKFIQKVGWQRLVVVSDDSEFSVEFERELTDLLQKEGIIFTSVRCEGAEFSLEKLRKKLHQTSPRIVIANIERGDELNLLMSHIRHNTTWILRDMKETEWKQLSAEVLTKKNVFSVSLRSSRNRECDDYVDNDIEFSVQTIASNMRYFISNVTDETKKKDFYSDFARKMNAEMKRSDALVCVKKLFPNPMLVSTIYVDSSGAKVRHFNQPFKKIPKDSPFCVAYSNKYFSPCDFALPLVFMFVCIMFFMTVCWLICFFDKTTPLNHNNYYRNFE